MLIVITKDVRYNGSVITAGTEMMIETLHEFLLSRRHRDPHVPMPKVEYEVLR